MLRRNPTAAVLGSLLAGVLIGRFIAAGRPYRERLKMIEAEKVETAAESEDEADSNTAPGPEPGQDPSRKSVRPAGANGTPKGGMSRGDEAEEEAQPDEDE